MNDAQTIAALENATDKQIEVLDRAADGLTSKQIALELALAPRSVDQRIDNLRQKAGGVPRADLVRVFRRWRETCDRTTCGPIPLTQSIDPEASPHVLKETTLVFEDAFSLDERAPWDRPTFRMRPGWQPSDLSPFAKLAAVMAVAALLLMSFSLIIATAQGIEQLARAVS